MVGSCSSDLLARTLNQHGWTADVIEGQAAVAESQPGGAVGLTHCLRYAAVRRDQARKSSGSDFRP